MDGAISTMLSASVLEDLAAAARLCFCGRRLEILLVLSLGPRDVGGLAEQTELDVPTVSKHLRVLRDAGIVAFDVHHRHRVYRLGPLVTAAAQGGRHVITIGPADGAKLVVSIPEQLIVDEAKPAVAKIRLRAAATRLRRDDAR